MSRPVPYIQDCADGCELTILARPRARRTEFAGTHDGALCVRVHAPPIGGKANAELIGFLAQELGVPKAAVAVRRGAASRRKVVTVRGRSAAAAARRISSMRQGA